MHRRIGPLCLEVITDLPGSLLEPLLGGFPACDEPQSPALSLRLRAGELPAVQGTPLFFHGRVLGHRLGDAVVVSDSVCHLVIAPDGRHIEGVVTPDALTNPHDFANVPMLIALVVALRHHGLFHLHAGTLVHPDGRGILVAGSGGSGKSTLTLALLEAGCAYLGDDTVLLGRSHGAPHLFAFPRPFHVSETPARAFPRLTPFVGETYTRAHGKRLLDADKAFPGRGRSAASPAIVLLPEIADMARTAIERVSGAEALGALVESSAVMVVDGLPGAEEQLGILRDISDAAASYRVCLGRDLLESPGAVGRGLSGTATTTEPVDAR